jgi:hypothetical protein
MKSVVYNQPLMRKLWNETFELFRRHVVLWVPSSVATILMLALGRLQTAETQWLMRTLSTQHSVFGRETQSSNIDQVFERTMMITVPLGFLQTVHRSLLFRGGACGHKKSGADGYPRGSAKDD